MNPIDLNKIFNLSDTGDLDKAIDKIEQLNKAIDVMVIGAQRNAQRYTDALDTIQQSVTGLEKSIEGLDATSKKDQDTLSKSAKAVDELASENEQYEEQLKQTEQTIKTLTEAQKKLIDSKKKLSDINSAEVGSLSDLKKQLSEAVKSYNSMGDAVDQSVKDEALKKIRDLSRTVNEADKAVKEAKKGIDATQGSYNNLAARVADAKKKLKDFEGGLGSQSKEFKELRKFVKEGSDELKEFDAAMGDNQRSVGDYTGALDTLVPGLGATSNGIQAATKAALTFIATPLGLILAGIAAALASVTAYFKSSQEAEDEFNQIVEISGVILDNLIDILEAVGKAIFNAISEPKKLWEDFLALIEPLTTTITDAFNDPLQAVKDFGQALLDNIISRFKAIGVAGKAIGKILEGEFAEGFKELGNAGIQAVTGIENGIDKIAETAVSVFDAAGKAMQGFFDKTGKEIQEARKIAALEAKFRREVIADIIDDSETELKVNELLAKAKDKVRVTDEERLAALREANKLLLDQAKGDAELARLELEIAERRAALNENTFEDNKALAELRAKVNEEESNFFKKQKEILSQEAGLVKEIVREREAKIKLEKKATEDLNKFLLSDRLATNREILKDDDATLEARLEAVKDILATEQQLAQMARAGALDAAKEAAIARVELSDETLAQIYADTTRSLDDQLAAERAAKEELIGIDKAYQDERERISGEYFAKVDELNEAGKDLVQENIFTILQRDFDRLDDSIQTKAAEQILALNQALEEGTLTVEEYGFRRNEVLAESNREALLGQLDFLEKQLANTELTSTELLDLERQIAQTRLDLSDATTDQLIANETRYRDSVKAVLNETVGLATDVFNAQIEQNIAHYEQQLAIEEEAKNKSLELATNDAHAREVIEAEFAEKQKEIQKQIAAEKKKQVIFDRIKGTAEVIINTAKGISLAVAESPLTFGLPWSAFVGAVGALQLTRILAAPIPQFFMGTDFAPGGASLVGDRGPELVVSPSGEMSYYKNPTILDMERGSKVLTAQETADFMKDPDYWYNNDLAISNIAAAESLAPVIVDTKLDELGLILGEKFTDLERTIKNKKEYHFNLSRGKWEIAVKEAGSWTRFIDEEYP